MPPDDAATDIFSLDTRKVAGKTKWITVRNIDGDLLYSGPDEAWRSEPKGNWSESIHDTLGPKRPTFTGWVPNAGNRVWNGDGWTQQ